MEGIEMNNKQTVLIIEDSPLTVKILKNILKNEYEVLSAFSGEDGYELAIKKMPDIIILDVVMTGMDGYEVCKRLKENDLTKPIPVIFISALGEMEDEWKGLEIGAIDYITKPFSEPIVKIRIKNHLELKKHRDILAELSSHDGLTGIYNRRYFDNTSELEWKKAIANKSPYSLILLDIDKFKIYNDNYGHLEGDECLIFKLS
jgi:PleD family two-component response regulator